MVFQCLWGEFLSLCQSAEVARIISAVYQWMSFCLGVEKVKKPGKERFLGDEIEEKNLILYLRNG